MQKELTELRSCSVMGLITLLKALRNDSDLPAPWDTDLENASICLELALEKMRAELLGQVFVGGPEDTGAGKVAGNNEAGRAAESEEPQPVKFADLGAADKDEALAFMVELRQVSGLKTEWENATQLHAAISAGYDPGNHFSFRRRADGAVLVLMQ